MSRKDGPFSDPGDPFPQKYAAVSCARSDGPQCCIDRRHDVCHSIPMSFAKSVESHFPWVLFSGQWKSNRNGDQAKIFEQVAFWNGFGTVDILIDLATALLPTYLLYDLHIGWRKKLPVILAFSSRIL